MTEHELEQVALDWLRDTGWQVLHGPSIATDEPQALRERLDEAHLPPVLRGALARLNPTWPAEDVEEAYRQFRQALSVPGLLESNLAFHQMLIEGVPVRRRVGEEWRNYAATLIDFTDPGRNEFFAINQFTMRGENPPHRRADIVLFVNGLPLVVIEIKSPTSEEADELMAYEQLRTYKGLIPALFQTNALLIASDGMRARVGSLTSEFSRYMPWKTIDGKRVPSDLLPELEVTIRGMLRPQVLLRVVRSFTVFEKGRVSVEKKIAAYHQYHAVLVAAERTVQAINSDGRIGVVWHTQGSGKSLSMVFYAGMLAVDPSLKNPTIVVLTDRNDLDDQLFSTFAACSQLLRQTPVQASTREELRRLLSTATGGIVFTTIQKFMPGEGEAEMPVLSERKNIIVIADEAHRSQYDFVDGFAHNVRRALKNASFIGFTGTPIAKEDRSTVGVFGEYIDIYDIQQAVEDKATVPIYYESRLAKVRLLDEEKPNIDKAIDELLEGEELTANQERLAKWTATEQIVGTPSRIEKIATDIIQHFEQRQQVIEGKAMIVCMSRRIAVEMYHAIIRQRPDWEGDTDGNGVIKVVMTGSASDPLEWQPFIRTKEQNRVIADRFKNPNDSLKLVIVRDMWLTGFDAPILNTLYIDKPMRGHNLAQAIARVNRVYKDKVGGRIVDYIGIAQNLKEVLATYTDSGGRAQPTYDIDLAIEQMTKRYELVVQMFTENPGFYYREYFTIPPGQKLSFVLEASNFVLGIKDGRQRYSQLVSELLKSYGLAVPSPEAIAIREDVGFFQFVRTEITKATETSKRFSDKQLETAIRQIISESLITEGVVDIFGLAGLQSPEVSILSDEFLEELRNVPQKNLAAEMLRRLLKEEIRKGGRTNLVLEIKFSERLDEAVKRYQNAQITSAMVIEELLSLAKEYREASNKGVELGLNDDEFAFYMALEQNGSAVSILGDEILRTIARELVISIRNSTSLDWSIKESVKARIRVNIKRILKKYKYPPDLQEKAVLLVLEQSERLFDVS